MAPHKVGPRRKVGPARIAKTKHKFAKSKHPEASPVSEGSVVDGGDEPTPTDDDSGKLTISKPFDLERPAIRHSDDEDVPPGGPDVRLLPKKRNKCQREQTSLTVRQGGEDLLEESLPDGSDYNDAEEHEPSSDSHSADDPPAQSKQGATGKTSLPCISPAPPGRKDKGKGRKLPPPADIEDLDNDQNDVDVDKSSGDPLTSGRLPQEAIDKAIALGKKTVEEAKSIAKEYGKSVRTILIQDGLSVKPTRAENSWNMYQVWYKMQHPKSSDAESYDWKEAQHAHWIKHCDQSENPELWEEIHEFWEGISKNPDESPKAIYNRIMAIRDAFATSITYSRLEDIYVGGFVLYTGTEEAGRRAAGVFAGSPLILDLVNEKQADIKKLVDYLTTVIKYKRIDDTVSLPSFAHMMGPKFNPELSCEKGEGTRDRNRRVAPLMMLEKFAKVGIPHEAKNIPWKTMLNSLYLCEVQVVDWPAGVSLVGPDFVFKDLKTDELKALVGPYLKRCMGSDYNAELARVEHHELKKKKKDGSGALKVLDKELVFVPWSDESKELSRNEDPEMLNIPLITDTQGEVLRTLMDSILFMKNLPAGIELPDSTTPRHNSLTPQSSSPLDWSSSPPHHNHHKVSQPLPRTVPATMIPPWTHQPTLPGKSAKLLAIPPV
ncbi:hypothetical protein EV424DRAFT_1533540 [Suillus variegatus]|nr:hypothetical protein EV424DRAFT_1533540 [Suillus variegatus]